MNNKIIAEELSEAVDYMRYGFGLECTLTEILTLRRNVVKAIETNLEVKYPIERVIPHIEAVTLLLMDHYGMDMADIWYRINSGRKKGKILLGKPSTLIAGTNGRVDERFKEYLRGVQERLYGP